MSIQKYKVAKRKYERISSNSQK